MPSGNLLQLSCVSQDMKSILNLASDEYCTIAKEMQGSIVDHVNCCNAGGCFSRYEIVMIQKLLNTDVYQQYLQVRSQVQAENGSANEHMLFHGSPHIAEVMNSGFDTSFASPDGLFGAGIYFAKHSSKSNQYAFGHMGGTGCPEHGDKNCFVCERQLLLCRVALGKVFEVTKDREAKALPSGYHSLMGVANEIGSSRNGLRYPEYVVYKGKQAYPDYVITYKIAP